LAGTANSLGPHQAETIREVTHDAADEQRRSPRVSLDNRNSLDEIDSFADELVANPSGANSRAQGTRDNNDSTMNQEDALAAAQNGGVSSSDEGELDGDDDLDDDMMDKISSSPSIEDEDIDFEFVYALHTFVATVEGQANATKGDTMVLLDDSNSYWWLVRVVKDSSIGYLPAEHIETPTERLARLNKHRNVDVCEPHLRKTEQYTDRQYSYPPPCWAILRRRRHKLSSHRLDSGGKRSPSPRQPIMIIPKSTTIPVTKRTWITYSPTRPLLLSRINKKRRRIPERQQRQYQLSKMIRQRRVPRSSP
jgi:hypothetical protein